jgi:hypothetical protein
VEQSVVIADIFDRDIVSYDIAVEPSLQLLAQFAIRIDPNVVRRGQQKNVRIEMTLGVENTRLLRRFRAGFANVISGLSVQKTNAIGASDAQFRARGKIEKRQGHAAAQ